MCGCWVFVEGGKLVFLFFIWKIWRWSKSHVETTWKNTHVFFSKEITICWMEQSEKKTNHNFWMEKIRVEHLQTNTKTSLFKNLFFSFLQPAFWSKELGREAMTCTLCSAKKSGKVSCPGSSNTWESLRFLESFVFFQAVFLFENWCIYTP